LDSSELLLKTLKEVHLTIFKQLHLIQLHHICMNVTVLCPTCNGCVILHTFQLINVFVVRSAVQLLPECEIWTSWDD